MQFKLRSSIHFAGSVATAKEISDVPMFLFELCQRLDTHCLRADRQEDQVDRFLDPVVLR